MHRLPVAAFFTTLHTLYRNCDWFYCVFHFIRYTSGKRSMSCHFVLIPANPTSRVASPVCFTSCSKQITPSNFFFYFSSLSWGVPLQLSPHPCLAPDWVHLQYFDLALWLTGKVRTWHLRRSLYPHTTKLLWYVGITPSVCPSVRPASRVRSVAPTVLVGSISHLYILSSNFRRCVAKFQNLSFWHFFFNS